MLVEFYGVEAGFPLATHLITRSLEAAYPKRIYYVSDSLLALLLADTDERLKITSTGLFERHELRGRESGKCQYRIAQEGLPFLMPHVTRQILRLSVADFIRLLTEKNLPLLVPGTAEADAAAAAAAAAGKDKAAAAAAAEPVDTPSKQQPLSSPAVLKQLEGIESGGAVAMLEEEAAQQLGLAVAEASGALTANAPLAISVWRTRASLSVLVAKAECEQLVDKIRAAMQRHQQQQQEQQPAEGAAAAEPALAAV